MQAQELRRHLSRLRAEVGLSAPYSASPVVSAQAVREQAAAQRETSSAIARPNWRELLTRLRPAEHSPQPATSHARLTLAALGMREIFPGVGVIDSQRPCSLHASPEALHKALGVDCARESLLAFDLETSGLGQAAGVRAFMVGIARVHGTLIHIRQYLLLRPGSERLLLQEAFKDMANTPDLLSYNGRSFDWPLLRERARLVLRRELSAPQVHADLLHLVRRRYRGVWPDCRLKTTEKMLLGHERSDDLPGSEAPAAWTRFLQTGDAHLLCRVAQHNADDLFSLHLIADQLALRAIEPT